MSVWSTHGRGRCSLGEDDVVVLPRAFRQDGTVPGIIYCHGARGSALSISDPFQGAGEWALVRGIAERYPVVSADLGGHYTFGNPLTVARIDEARRYLQQTWGARPGPVVLLGASMGGVGILNYAASHRDLVLAAIGVIPAIDLDDLASVDGGVFASSIAAAWGIAQGEPLPAGASPARNVELLRGLPFQAWYADDDTLTRSAPVRAIVDQMGAPAEAHDLGMLGHSQAAIGAVVIPEVLAFLDAHLG